MKALIVAGGIGLNKESFKEIISSCNLIAAADSGYLHLNKLGVEPDFLVGDFDSLGHEFLDGAIQKGIQIIRHPVEKDKTDTELAIDILSQHGVDEVVMIGGTGSRLDHTLSNIQSLRYMHMIGIAGCIIDNFNKISYLSNGSIEIPKDKSYVSILPLGLEGAVISLEGFHYDLDHRKLDYGSSLGVSNYIEVECGHVTCHSGEIFILITND